MSSRTWTDENLINAVKNNKTYSDVARQLGLNNYGANSKTIKKYISKLKLDTSHFLTKSEILQIARSMAQPLSYADIFCINKIDRRAIKNAVIKNNLIPYICSGKNCAISEWHGYKLSLHLDHINGINNDNRLENLRFLCPNCHSLTDTYCGKQLRGLQYGKEQTCIDCKCTIKRKSSRCRSCATFYSNKTKINWLPTEQLIKLVDELGYVRTGKQLGVSGNAIKKRIRNHPSTILFLRQHTS